MGDVADDAYNAAMRIEEDFAMMIANIRRDCTTGGCAITENDDDDDDAIWAPYVCTTCGRSFDV